MVRDHDQTEENFAEPTRRIEILRNKAFHSFDSVTLGPLPFRLTKLGTQV